MQVTIFCLEFWNQPSNRIPGVNWCSGITLISPRPREDKASNQRPRACQPGERSTARELTDTHAHSVSQHTHTGTRRQTQRKSCAALSLSTHTHSDTQTNTQIIMRCSIPPFPPPHTHTHTFRHAVKRETTMRCSISTHTHTFRHTDKHSDNQALLGVTWRRSMRWILRLRSGMRGM